MTRTTADKIAYASASQTESCLRLIFNHHLGEGNWSLDTVKRQTSIQVSYPEEGVTVYTVLYLRKPIGYARTGIRVEGSAIKVRSEAFNNKGELLR